MKEPNDGIQKPDLAIGLCSYNVDTHPWNKGPGKKLADDDRVKLFDRVFLYHLLQRHFGIPLLSHRRKNQSKDQFPLFVFALWESKSAIGSDTNETAASQTAPNLKTLLCWQQEFYKKSGVDAADACPLVWYFNHVGSRWEFYGGYIQQSQNAPGGDACVRLAYVSYLFPCLILIFS
jgi:hypothetical protein